MAASLEEKDESMKKKERSYQRYRDLISTLPKEKGWLDNLCQYKGFWYHPTLILEGTMFAEEHFQARPTDVFLMSTPKSGTTWLKALIFAIVKRSCYTNFADHPLLTTNPHDCVPFLETDVENIPSPRLLATHSPYVSLPKSVLSSDCKIVYVCRNPKDVLISFWYFMANLRPNELPPISLEEGFELFCKGISDFGPIWDHVLGYWKASLEYPQRFFFITYEEMKRDASVKVKKLAEFLGQPFSTEEETKGVVEEIIELCSFDKLRNLEVNKSSSYYRGLLIQNETYFREGKVGDWRNHLTTQMIERLDQITNEKLPGLF